MTPDPLARPVFVVAPPRAGARSVADVLAAAPGCWRLGGAAGALLRPVPELDPPDGTRDGRLVAADCTPAVRERVRANLHVHFARRRRPASDADANEPAVPRLVDASPRNALRIPFLARAFPDATFVYVHRQPVDALAESLLLWRAGSAITYPDLPGWTGPAWSFLLVPGWQQLRGRPLPEVVTAQWVRTMHVLTDDLEELGPERWCVVGYEALRTDARTEAARVLRYLELELPPPGSLEPPTAGLPAARLAAARAELEPYLDRAGDLADLASDWIAAPEPPR